MLFQEVNLLPASREKCSKNIILPRTAPGQPAQPLCYAEILTSVSTGEILSIINFGRDSDIDFLISRDLFPLHIITYSSLYCQLAALFLLLILISGARKGER